MLANKQKVIFVSAILFTTVLSKYVLAQSLAPSTAPIFPVVLYIKSLWLGLPEPVEIRGDVSFNPLALNGPSLLAAKELRMWPGSRLLLTAPFSSLGSSREAVVMAVKKITVMPAEKGKPVSNPPTITWANISSEVLPAPQTGKASPGRAGETPGAPGADGQSGMAGNPGFFGQSAPHIYLAVEEISGGSIIVDLRGQRGGKGGQGQAGGDGGPGATGTPSVSSILDCSSGPGRGGKGGSGGVGGDGGRGGAGGNGGALFLLASVTQMTEVSKFIVFSGAGGDGGDGGPPGPIGQPGRGGNEGRIGGFCGSANRNGPGGDEQKGRGSIGGKGPDGVSGAWTVFQTEALVQP